MQATLGSLTDAEQALIRETERDSLATMDEDALLALHLRVRRARDKYVKLYRRQSAVRVGATGGRGKAFPKGSRDRGKAEVFEEALARVSRRLAAVARASAEALKRERIDEARATRNESPPRAAGAQATAVRASPRSDRRPRTPYRVKRHASTRSANARKQARRDSR